MTGSARCGGYRRRCAALARPGPDASEDMLTARLEFDGGFESNLAFCSTVRGF